jgi:hypothetical protein
MVDSQTKAALAGIPLLKTNAGPRDAEWNTRLKEELIGLIQVRLESSFDTLAVREEQQRVGQRLVPAGVQ